MNLPEHFWQMERQKKATNAQWARRITVAVVRFAMLHPNERGPRLSKSREESSESLPGTASLGSARRTSEAVGAEKFTKSRYGSPGKHISASRSLHLSSIDHTIQIPPSAGRFRSRLPSSLRFDCDLCDKIRVTLRLESLLFDFLSH